MLKEIGTWHHLDLKLRLAFFFFTYNKNGKTSHLLIGSVGGVGDGEEVFLLPL